MNKEDVIFRTLIGRMWSIKLKYFERDYEMIIGNKIIF